MSNYNFLREKNTDNKTIYAVEKSLFETIELAECYEEHGQKWGHCNAQDYSLHNSECDAEKNCLKELRKKFKIDGELEVLINDNNKGFFINTDAELSDKKIKEINSFIDNWEKKNSNYEEVLAYTYFEGHNLNTIIIKGDNFDECCTHEVIEDEEFIQELEEAIDNKKLESDDDILKKYKGGRFLITYNRHVSSFANYEIEEL